VEDIGTGSQGTDGKAAPVETSAAKSFFLNNNNTASLLGREKGSFFPS
jgi:hypothetical protein